jgi:hypothetical protein
VALPPKPVVAPVKAIGITGAAFGQTKPPNVFEYATSPVSIVVVPIAPTVRDTSGAPVSMGATSVSPNWKPVALKPAPLPAPERTPDVVVINYGKGGRVDEHKQRFADYRLTKTRVELRGPCYSACTLLLTYVEPENLCISPGAFMAFHAVRGLERGVRMDEDTWRFYIGLPTPVRRWIDRNGGQENLPLNGYWTMYDHELWAIGYPRCAP